MNRNDLWNMTLVLLAESVQIRLEIILHFLEGQNYIYINRNIYRYNVYIFIYE